MEKLSFTLSEAQSICEDLQCLLGHYLDGTRRDLIRYVIPAPFHQEQQQFFFYVWSQTECPYKALEHYKGNSFDVLAVAGLPGREEKVVYRDVQTFFTNNKIAFDLSLYKTPEAQIA